MRGIQMSKRWTYRDGALTCVYVTIALLTLGCGGSPEVSRQSTAAATSSASPNPWLREDAIAKALAFRQSSGLRSDPQWIREVASKPASAEGARLFGVPLMPDETAILTARARTADQIMDLVQEYGQRDPETWGGAYVDPASGMVVAQFTGPLGVHKAGLATLVYPGAALSVRQVRWALADLKALQKRISRDLWLTERRYRLISVGARIRGNFVLLRISTSDAGAGQAIIEHFDGAGRLQIESDGTGVRNLPTGSLRGIATYSDGKPAAGLDVELVADASSDVGLGDIGHETSKVGVFKFDQIPAMGYEVRLLRSVDDHGNSLEGDARILAGTTRAEVAKGQVTFVVVVVHD